VTGKRVEIAAGTQVDAPTTRFAGTVQAETVIADANVSVSCPSGCRQLPVDACEHLRIRV
jgi:hypothetical protein